MSHSLVDFHSHILPKMDDGAEDIARSCEMLRLLASQGVDTVFCTSHFLLMHESPSDYLTRRQRSYDALCSYIKEQALTDLPKIKLGAEIRVSRGISEVSLSGLEYEGTDAMLLELPREELSRTIVKQIYNLCRSNRYIPVIAHIDRYEWFKPSDIDTLSEIPDVIFQFSLHAISDRRIRKTMLKMAKQGQRLLFGTDTHNTDDRAPNFSLLTGLGGRSPLSAKERDILLSSHMEATEFIFNGRDQSNAHLFF